MKVYLICLFKEIIIIFYFFFKVFTEKVGELEKNGREKEQILKVSNRILLLCAKFQLDLIFYLWFFIKKNLENDKKDQAEKITKLSEK